MHLLEGIHAVVVVGIDDRERLLHAVAGAQHRVHRAVGLGAALGHLVPGRQGAVILEGVLHADLLGQLVAADALHVLQHVRPDDEDHLVKARADRVAHGILQQDLVVGAHARDLLVAAVAGRHARRHYDQRRVHDDFLPCIIMVLICLLFRSSDLECGVWNGCRNPCGFLFFHKERSDIPEHTSLNQTNPCGI